MEVRKDDLFVALEKRGAVLKGGEEDEDVGNILADLMPGCCEKIVGENETIDTVDFAEICHMLSNQGAMDFLEGPKLNTIIGKGDSHIGVPAVDNSSLSTWYNHQNKENIPLDPNILPRRSFARREGSGRTTTQHSFKLDLRDIGQPPLDSSQSYYIPKDVNAFWEAEDEREAFEAILQKLQGKAQTEEVSNQLVSMNQKRHVLVRQKGSGRRTIRKFDIELPPYVEKLGFAGKDQLNEEGEKGSFVCSTGDLIACPGMSKDGTSPMPTNNTLNSVERIDDRDAMKKGQTIEHDCTLKAFCVEPPTGKASDCLHIRQNPSGCNQLLSVANNLDDAGKLGNDLDCEIFISVDRWPILSTDCEDFANTEKEMSKLIPYHKDIIGMLNKSTPVTSPTPPANPLEALGLKKDIFGQDGETRSLDFGNVVSKSDLNGDSASDGLQSDLAPEESEPCDEQSENKVNTQPDNNSQNHSKVLESVNGEKCAQKSRKSNLSKKMRNSLEGAGTSVEDGVRRSLRIRSRPLEYWRGERFLFGRVHDSLVTVIGMKHSSPPVCWPKRGYKGPNFKVESFVPDEYADYVRFAAL